MYTCARCGEKSIEDIAESAETEHTEQVEGWCDVCDDYRPIVE